MDCNQSERGCREQPIRAQQGSCKRSCGARFGQSWPGAPGVRAGFLAAKRGVSTMDRAAAGRDRSEGAPSRLLGLSSRALK